MAYPSNASKKQSQFLSTDTIPGSAYFGLWDNGANYRISFANLLAGLGATGTLSQLGDGGQPLLYQAGADNYIRNLKAGFGVTLTQEATEEVTVANGTCSSSQSARITTVWQAELSPSDTVQVRVANNDDTTDIIVTDMVLRIN